MSAYRSALSVLVCVVGNALCAQLPDIYGTDAAGAASYLLGDNVTILHPSFSGDGRQIGTFSDGASKLNMDKGVILATGHASYAGIDYTDTGFPPSWGTSDAGPNRPVDNPMNSEIDLDVLNGTGSVFSAAVLEFDLITTGTSFELQIIYASEEYPEENCGPWNDVFGIFLSGPGISGPYANSAINIATNPTTGYPISMNSINNGQNGWFSECDPATCAAADPNWQSNTSYYRDNFFNNPVGNPLNEGNAQLVYDGLTTVIPIGHAVQCNQTYHLKIAICSTGDGNKDSALFLKKGTLTSSYSLGPLTATAGPLCEGGDLGLSVVGGPGWSYDWSDGQTGVGLTEIATPATVGTTSYSVTATYLPGCSLTTEVDGIVVHPENNQPPTCQDGQYVVQAGEPLNFQIPTNDAQNEDVTIIRSGGNAGGSFSVLDLSAPHETGVFTWTPGLSDIGQYTMEATATDNNACSWLESTCLFNIKVVCAFCPICVYYENRSPSGLPLPPLTEAGQCITAGRSVDASQTDGPVTVGDAEVVFRAPVIDLQAGFNAGPNFLAEADPNTCISDCQDCCEDWPGLSVDTYDPDEDGVYELVNVFSPDGNGVNDYWGVYDYAHPWCAYGAQAFELTIKNQWGTTIWYLNEVGESCCPFESRAPNHQIPHSSIYWDGTINTGFTNCYGCNADESTYFYVLHIWGCGGSVDYAGSISLFRANGFQVDPTVDPATAVAQTGEGVVSPGEEQVAAVLDVEDASASFTIFPNPAHDRIEVRSPWALRWITLLDPTGRVLLRQAVLGAGATTLDVGTLASGNYLLAAEGVDGAIVQRKFVKQ